MPTEESIWEILGGETQTADLEITLVESGSSGDSSALRTLSHPDSTNFPIVTYNRNPDRTINFDQEPLFPPDSQLFRTLGTTQAFVSSNQIDDVKVTERWNADSSRASMIASQFRRLYELVINRPAVSDPEVFVQWAPRDRTTKVYNVILLDIRVGGGPRTLDVKEIGRFPAGTLDAVATGLLDRFVELDLLIISEVSP